jgi:hypothetical protein
MLQRVGQHHRDTLALAQSEAVLQKGTEGSAVLVQLAELRSSMCLSDGVARQSTSAGTPGG